MLIGRQPGAGVDVALPAFWGGLDYTTLVTMPSTSFFEKGSSPTVREGFLAFVPRPPLWSGYCPVAATELPKG